MRYEGNKVVITESELHDLVNESVKAYLNENSEDEGVWGGIKNAFNGVMNGNFNLGRTYKTGNWASSFEKYARQAGAAIGGMEQIAYKTKNTELVNSLSQIYKQISQQTREFRRLANNEANGGSPFNTKVNNAFMQNGNNNVNDNTNVNLNGANQNQNNASPELGNVRNRQQKPTETDYARGMMGNNNGDGGDMETSQPYYSGNGLKPDPKAVAQSKERDNDMNNAFNGLTRDYDMDYNSVRPRKVMPEGKTIRITQDYIRSLVNETLNILMNEEGEAGGGGATNAAGVMQGGGTNPGAGTYDAPAFGGKNKKKVGGNAFSEPIMRQKHNLGDVTKAPANQVDMKPALDRTPGFSMGERKK